MPKKTLTYQPGDWFAVPLPSGGLAVGLVARMNGKGIVLGYFFGPRRHNIPTLAAISKLDQGNAISSYLFGDLGLLRQKWHLIAPQSVWCPEDWPVPAFGRIDVSGEKAWRVSYADPSLDWLIDEQITVEEAQTLPRDGLFGAVAIERLLDHLLPMVEGDHRDNTQRSDGSQGMAPTPRQPPSSMKGMPASESLELALTGDNPRCIDGEQAVFVFLALSDDGIGTARERSAFERLEDGLSNLLHQRGVGQFDGNEIGGGYYRLYLYGRNADAITILIESAVRDLPAPSGSYLLKRYGGPGTRMQRINL